MSHPIASTNTITFHKLAHYDIALSVKLDNPLTSLVVFLSLAVSYVCPFRVYIRARACASTNCFLITLSSIFVFLLHSTCPTWLKNIRGGMAGDSVQEIKSYRAETRKASQHTVCSTWTARQLITGSMCGVYLQQQRGLLSATANEANRRAKTKPHAKYFLQAKRVVSSHECVRWVPPGPEARSHGRFQLGTS